MMVTKNIFKGIPTKGDIKLTNQLGVIGNSLKNNK